MSPTPVLIDCDPGHDDAIALMLALASPEVELLGVTTVAGNTTLENTTANALRVLELADRPDIPVVAGCARPLVRELVVAENVHGVSGLDGPVLAPPSNSPRPGHAIDFLAGIILESTAPVTLIAVGPLTNIALLLSRYPEVVFKLGRIVSMGGAVGLGNVTPAAEFNIYVDPEAADVVYRAGVDVTLIGLDITHQAMLGTDHADRLRTVGECGRFVAELLDFFITSHPRTYTGSGAPIHDAVAVADVVWPNLISASPMHVEVDTTTGPCRGRTVADRWGVTDRPANARVGLDLDGERFSELLIERIARLP